MAVSAFGDWQQYHYPKRETAVYEKTPLHGVGLFVVGYFGVIHLHYG